ncbi:hypothetical protein [Paenibacillus sp. FSL H8-0537]|uniref:hypothetical protein n=1 Tax=Paenibacillus sp. FSL H8-0537 TaxID=2921399 RepID=UPI003100F2E1
MLGYGNGQAHSLLLKSDGTVWAWGKNDLGQLGNGTTVNGYPLLSLRCTLFSNYVLFPYFFFCI